ncbi:hypothetical protein MNBD_PLANCTO02-111 [hydrothermal vent metagenome]|uniref:Uncharacterized protein n=1 Tax=hydrothermal vent metagenome TaxID=652676 RepID=A0A3B1E3C5_9ZZZZ
MTVTIWTYAAYSGICVMVTIWVAESLRKNGRKMVNNDQKENKNLFDAFTHLLTVGLYLVNLGVVCLLLRYGKKPTDIETAIELLGTKIGSVLLVLGAMVFIIIAKLSEVRQGEQSRTKMKKNRELFQSKQKQDELVP